MKRRKQRELQVGDTYTCAMCGGVFEVEVTEEEAMAEYRDNFPGIPESEKEIVCDDCYNVMRNVCPFPKDLKGMMS